MDTNRKFANRDIYQMENMSWDDDLHAKRVIIVGYEGAAPIMQAQSSGGQALNPIIERVEVPVVVKEKEIIEIKVPQIVEREVIKTIEIPQLVERITVQTIEVPKIVSVVEYKEIQVPVITEKVIEIEKPYIVEKIKEVLPTWALSLIGFQGFLVVSLLGFVLYKLVH